MSVLESQPEALATQIWETVLWALVWSLYAVWGYWYYRRRKTDYLTARSPNAVLLTCAALCVNTALSSQLALLWHPNLYCEVHWLLFFKITSQMALFSCT